MQKYSHLILIVLVCLYIAHCLSEIRTSLAIKYTRDFPTNYDISSWRIGIVYEISLMKCIMSCMMEETCFWATFNSGTCERLSISRSEIDYILAITPTANNGGLPTYQMIKGNYMYRFKTT